MVLSTEWSQVEVIALVNDGSGLGFGIVGGRSTGVVIKSILPGGLADKDGRLQSGDHILQIGDVNVRGFSSEHVATVLRQSVLGFSGVEVRMIIARPVESTSSQYLRNTDNGLIVPTKIVINQEDLDYNLVLNGFDPIGDLDFDIDYYRQVNEIDVEEEEGNAQACNGNLEADYGSTDISEVTPEVVQPTDYVLVTPTSEDVGDGDDDGGDAESDETDVETLPETEKFTVALDRNECGLGITIAGYVCEREDLSGIFVKGISEGSQAAKCQCININDRIVAVDDEPLPGLTNYEAVGRLKDAGNPIRLTFERYLRGPKYDQLQEALASQQLPSQHHIAPTGKSASFSAVESPSLVTSATTCSAATVIPTSTGTRDPSPVSPSVTTLSWIPIDPDVQIDGDPETTSLGSEGVIEDCVDSREIFVDEKFEADPNADVETTIRRKWQELIGEDTDVVVAHLTKLKGLGISLEGTVDVEYGVEVRPHHYIRSILPEGPVGQNGKLSSGDELLEVNGQKLLGIRHVDVVKILKELPCAVRLVCARKQKINRVINTSQDLEAFEARNILGGSLKNLLPQPENRLLKALSDTSINTSSTATVTDEPAGVNTALHNSQSRSRSRSLENTNLAMWCDTVEYVELAKTERGLGFSILDYQDPMDEKSTVIVVRSLIPNGAAIVDGRIKPGDRLMSVNDRLIQNATLDQAVQFLKGSPLGPVKIGIAKPLPAKGADCDTMIADPS